MPFKSEAQHRKFRAMVADGNMEQSTLDEMMDETKKIHGKKHPIKALPERVKKASKKSWLKILGDRHEKLELLSEKAWAGRYGKLRRKRTSQAKKFRELTEDAQKDFNAVYLNKNASHWSCGKDTMSDYYKRKARNKRKGEEKVAFALFQNGFGKVAGGPGSGVTGENADDITFLETSPLISIGKRQEFMDSHTPNSTNVEIEVSKIKYKGQEKMVPKKLVRMMLNWEEIKDKPVDVIQDNNGDYHIMDGHHRGLAAILLKKKTMKANVYGES